MTRMWAALALTMSLICGAVVAAAPSSAAKPRQPHLDVGTTTPYRGAMFLVSAEGFEPGHTIHVDLHDPTVHLGTVKAENVGGMGNFYKFFRLPPSVTGTHPIAVYDPTTHQYASKHIFIRNQGMWTNTASPRPGGALTVAGDGYAAHASIKINFYQETGDLCCSTPYEVTVGHATTNSHGGFKKTVTLPKGKQGEAEIIVGPVTVYLDVENPPKPQKPSIWAYNDVDRGGQVDLDGFGWPNHHPLQVTISDGSKAAKFGTARAGDYISGRFQKTFVLPHRLSGTHVIVVTDPATHQRATTKIFIHTRGFYISSANPTRGSTIKVAGVHWHPNTVYKIHFQQGAIVFGKTYSIDKDIATIRTDSTGAFSSKATIPANAGPAIAVVRLDGSNDGSEWNVTVRVPGA